jgi:peptidoglycan hydrolase-like protein with peptidoglycan-binding domain
MSGDDTAVLQAVLAARGYPVHYVDGAFGAYLEDIVKDFQKAAFPDEPAEWDGIVGPKTWEKLLER